MRLKKYTLPFPALQAGYAILIYYNWFGRSLDRFSAQPIQRALTVVGCISLFFLMHFHPTFEPRKPVQEDEKFVYFGQGYIAAIVIIALGWTLNRLPCAPIIKYAVFLSAIPIIHLALSTRFGAAKPGVLHYPDINRPLDPDE